MNDAVLHDMAKCLKKRKREVTDGVLISVFVLTGVIVNVHHTNWDNKLRPVYEVMISNLWRMWSNGIINYALAI